MRHRSVIPSPVFSLALAVLSAASVALPAAGTGVAAGNVSRDIYLAAHRLGINRSGTGATKPAKRHAARPEAIVPQRDYPLPVAVCEAALPAILPPQTEYPEIMYTKSVVHVRSGPSTEYGITRTLLKGAKVTVVASKKGWNADKHANVPWSKLSTGGWISTDLLTAGAPLNVTGGDTKVTKYGPVNVRSGPATEYGIIKQLDAGAEVTVIATKRGWSSTDNATVNWSKISGGGWIVSYALK